MRNIALALLALVALLFGLAACGKVSLSSAQPVATIPDWEYSNRYDYNNTNGYNGNYYDGYNAGYSYGYYRHVSAPGMSDAQAALYRELVDRLSSELAANALPGQPGYRHLWPTLDARRAQRLTVRYDSFRQLLSWNYENLGDNDADGLVNTSDLVPVALYADWFPQAGSGAGYDYSVEDWRNWIDSDNNGSLDSANVDEVAMSYGRAVYAYLVLAGMAPDPAAMEPVGQVLVRDRLPGWPPQYLLNVPAGNAYACIEPVNAKMVPACFYVVSLAPGLPQVSVIDAP